jgi:hypothetical protein
MWSERQDVAQRAVHFSIGLPYRAQMWYHPLVV